MHCALCIALAALQAGATGTWYTSSWDGGFTPSASNILYGKGPDNPSPATADALVSGEMSIPAQAKDAAKCQFSVKRYSDHSVLRYGKSIGTCFIIQ